MLSVIVMYGLGEEGVRRWVANTFAARHGVVFPEGPLSNLMYWEVLVHSNTEMCCVLLGYVEAGERGGIGDDIRLVMERDECFSNVREVGDMEIANALRFMRLQSKIWVDSVLYGLVGPVRVLCWIEKAGEYIRELQHEAASCVRGVNVAQRLEKARAWLSFLQHLDVMMTLTPSVALHSPRRRGGSSARASMTASSSMGSMNTPHLSAMSGSSVEPFPGSQYSVQGSERLHSPFFVRSRSDMSDMSAASGVESGLTDGYVTGSTSYLLCEFERVGSCATTPAAFSVAESGGDAGTSSEECAADENDAEEEERERVVYETERRRRRVRRFVSAEGGFSEQILSGDRTDALERLRFMGGMTRRRSMCHIAM